MDAVCRINVFVKMAYHDIVQHEHSTGTIASYVSKQYTILKWLEMNNPDVVHAAWRDLLQNRNDVIAELSRSVRQQPWPLTDAFDHHTFTSFVTTVKGNTRVPPVNAPAGPAAPDVPPPGAAARADERKIVEFLATYSTASGYRSALRSLYVRYEKDWEPMALKLNRLFKGIKANTAKAVMPHLIGKRALPFETYVGVCQMTLKANRTTRGTMDHKQFLEKMRVRTWMIWQWNLCAEGKTKQ